MLVVSPTRELAAQIAEEAKQLTAFQQNFTVQVRYSWACSAPLLAPTSRYHRIPPCIVLLYLRHCRQCRNPPSPCPMLTFVCGVSCTRPGILILLRGLVQVMFGGTNINKDVSALNRRPPNILVGKSIPPCAQLSG